MAARLSASRLRNGSCVSSTQRAVVTRRLRLGQETAPTVARTHRASAETEGNFC